MQKYKVSFKGQNIYVGIDVHLKTWHVTTLTESGCKYSFAQNSQRSSDPMYNRAVLSVIPRRLSMTIP